MRAHAMRFVLAIVAGATFAPGSAVDAAGGAAPSVEVAAASCPPLENGVAAAGLSAAPGAQPCFTISVPPASSRLTVTLGGGTGNADLYLRLGAVPTTRTYDCRSAGRTNAESCTIANPAAGTWYVMLTARTAYFGASLTGAYAAPACSPLQNGVAATGLSAPKGGQACFTVAVPPGQSVLTVNTAGGTGDADLYVRFGALPTTRLSDCRSTGRTNAETCTIGSPAAGTWVVMLLADTAFSGASLTAAFAQTGGSLVVSSLEDPATAPAGVTTLRLALATAAPGEAITFDPALDGGTIRLGVVGDAHTVLEGEVYSANTFVGYQDRDYGPSALYARKDVVLDASALPSGITLEWTGGEANPARVLAVYGNLTMKNVNVRSGWSAAGATGDTTQPYTLARGGGIAVWGTVRLERCTIAGNTVVGDTTASRDRGAYGGGIYANGLDLRDVVVSGNRAMGYGAAGGGIYSVGGADNTLGRGNDTSLQRCAVTGNLVRAQHAYGGGVFTLSGGPNNLATMTIANCTIARNLVQDEPALADVGQYYYRGGGVYMGGGSLSVLASTIAENAVDGTPATFSGKPNLGGGGVAATIGNAHTVENVWVQDSIVVGNTVEGAAEDWFTGSLLDFRSRGHNLVGRVDFSQILVPVPPWMDLPRKRWPKAGDQDGVALGSALDVGGAAYDATIVSAGTDAGGPALLWYPPGTAAVDEVPASSRLVTYVDAGYSGYGAPTDDFLNHVLLQLRQQEPYRTILGSDFGASFGDLTGTTWYGPARTWPSEPANAAWIKFWRDLDVAIGDRLGMVILGDDFWGTFTTGQLGNVVLTVNRPTELCTRSPVDQTGQARPSGVSDIGAIER